MKVVVGAENCGERSVGESVVRVRKRGESEKAW